MKKKKGQALLEIVLVLPIILMLFCGIVDFGRILHAGASLNMVAQESVRLAGLGKSDTEIKQFVLNKADLSDNQTIAVTITPPDRKSGDYVTVNLSYPIKYITPLVSVILPSPFMVNTQATIRVE